MKKTIIIILSIAISAVIITALALLTSGNRTSDSVPTLKLETPQKVSLSDETVTLDLTVSALGEALPWRGAWQPTPVSLPGESHGQRSLMGYSPWGCKESDMTEAT